MASNSPCPAGSSHIILPILVWGRHVRAGEKWLPLQLAAQRAIIHSTAAACHVQLRSPGCSLAPLRSNGCGRCPRAGLDFFHWVCLAVTQGCDVQPSTARSFMARLAASVCCCASSAAAIESRLLSCLLLGVSIPVPPGVNT